MDRFQRVNLSFVYTRALLVQFPLISYDILPDATYIRVTKKLEISEEMTLDPCPNPLWLRR